MTSPSGTAYMGGQRCPEEMRNSTRLWIRRDPSLPRDSWQNCKLRHGRRLRCAFASPNPSAVCLYGGTKMSRRDVKISAFYIYGHHSRAAVVAHNWHIVNHCQTINVDGCRQTVKLQSFLRLCSGFYRSKGPTNSIKVLKETITYFTCCELQPTELTVNT